MKGFNPPSHAIPLQFFNGFATRTHGQVGDQFPVDFLPPVWCATFLCVDHGQQEFGVLLVFTDGRKHPDTAVFDFQNGFRPITFFITDLEAMQSLDVHFFHFRRNRMFPVSGQPIHAGAHQEMGAQRLGGAEKLVNLALSVTDMNAALRVVQKGGGLGQGSSQRMFSFFSIGTRVGLIFFLSALQPLNSLRVQNFMAVKQRGRPAVVTAKLECI